MRIFQVPIRCLKKKDSRTTIGKKINRKQYVLRKGEFIRDYMESGALPNAMTFNEKQLIRVILSFSIKG